MGTFLKRRKGNQISMPLALSFRLILITILLFAWHSIKSTAQFLILMAQAGYLFYVIFVRPHKQSFDFFRSICLEVGLLYILLMRFLETNLLQKFVDSSSFIYPLVISIQYAFYLIGIIVSLLSLIYHLFLRRDKNKIETETEIYL